VAVIAFAGGVFFASGMDFTRFAWAQNSTTTARPVSARGPGAPEGNGSFADIAERVTPTVVAVNTTRNARPTRLRSRGQAPQGMEDFLEQFGQRQQPQVQRGEGSGFILTTDGYIVTNNHVVADADQVNVTLSDGRIFKAKVVGTDSTTDVAVVKIEAKSLPTLPVGNDETVRIGDWVLAVGNPLGLDFTVTAGIVSAKGRGQEIQLPNAGGMSISDFIQTDAAINPGNSGGPLINVRGEVIGLNSAIASQTGFYSGYGFAIPITLVKSVADMLIKDGKVRLPMLGIGIAPLNADDAGINGLSKASGVKVGNFLPLGDRSPAKLAGIEPGDVIVAVDGKPVDRVSALQRVVRAHKVGETVPVDVLRFGSKKSFKVKLVEADQADVASATPKPVSPSAAPAAGKLGITVGPIDAELVKQLGLPADKGVMITDVAQDGASADKLEPRSDIILEVLYPTPKHAVKNVGDLQSVLSALKAGDYVSLMVQSLRPGAGTRVVNIRVGG
jgi:serine protease Do